MVIAWHDAAFTLDEPVLTPELMFKILKKFQLQHELKKNWSRDEAIMMEKMFMHDEAKVISELKDMGESPSGEKPKDPEMVKRQEELARKIEAERMDLKAMRENLRQ